MIPAFIDALNEELATGEITYDVDGVKQLCTRVKAKFENEQSMEAIVTQYIPELQVWMAENI